MRAPAVLGFSDNRHSQEQELRVLPSCRPGVSLQMRRAFRRPAARRCEGYAPVRTTRHSRLRLLRNWSRHSAWSYLACIRSGTELLLAFWFVFVWFAHQDQVCTQASKSPREIWRRTSISNGLMDS